MAEPTVKRLDSRSLRALAHPLRLRLLGALRTDGPATASRLARRFGESSGATSYHLRQLERAGFVADDPALGNRRERWWKAAQDFTSWSTSEFIDDPADREAAEQLLTEVVRIYSRDLERWAREETRWPRRWIDAATTSDWSLRLDPATLRRLSDELRAVVERYREEAPKQDVERVRVIVHTAPQRDEGPPPA